MAPRITLAEASANCGISKRSLLQAAKSRTLRTTASVRGYLTTPEWLATYVATRRSGRPRKAKPAA